MAGQSTFKLNFKVGADTSGAIAQINKLNAALNNIQSKPVSIFNPNEFKNAVSAAEDIQKALQNAIDTRTGKFDLSRFALSIQDSRKSLAQLQTQLMSAGEDGQRAFLELSTTIANAERPTSRLVGMFQKLGRTFINTINWNITNAALRAVTGTLKSAMGYAEDLNRSLNNIRIVTGKSADEMGRFAKTATEAAKSLSATTKEYADAALIYYRQGLSDEEVKERANVTMKMANVTQESAQQVSEHLTAVWNNFDDGTKSLEYYADVMTKLGATTASSTTEISEGLEKFAAIADTVGLSYEYAASALATVTATTRQSADIVGTAFKTLFARMESLKLGEDLEDGTTMGNYAQALATVGVNIKDANGELRNMDDILDDLGAKWQLISNDQQVALAQTVAGVRQYSQLMALMNNWDFMKENVANAQSSEGTLAQQQAIYAQSWEASSERVRAAWEDVYNFIADDDFFIGLNDLLSGTLIPALEGFIKGLGGIKGILLTLGGNILTRMATEVPRLLNFMQREGEILIGLGEKRARVIQKENAELSQQAAIIAEAAGQHKLAAQLRGNANISNIKAQKGLSVNEQNAFLHRASVKRTVLTNQGQEIENREKQDAALQQKRDALNRKILQEEQANSTKILKQQEKEINRIDNQIKLKVTKLNNLQQQQAKDPSTAKTEGKKQQIIEENKQRQETIDLLNDELDKLREIQETQKNLADGTKTELEQRQKILDQIEDPDQLADFNADADDLINFTSYHTFIANKLSSLKKDNFENLSPEDYEATKIGWGDFLNSIANDEHLQLANDTREKLLRKKEAFFNITGKDEQNPEEFKNWLFDENNGMLSFLKNDGMQEGLIQSILSAKFGLSEIANRNGVKQDTLEAFKRLLIEQGENIGENFGNATTLEEAIGRGMVTPEHERETAESISEVTGAFMQLAGVMQSVQGLTSTLMDDSADATQKLTAVGGAALSLVMTFNTLKKMTEEGGLLGGLGIGGPQIAIVMAAVVAIAALIKVQEELQKNTTEEAKAARELIKQKEEENQQIQELTDAYKSLYEQKRQGLDVDDDLKSKAIELAKSLDDELAMVYALTGQYDRLAQAAENAEQARYAEILNEAEANRIKQENSLEQQLKHLSGTFTNVDGQYNFAYNQTASGLSRNAQALLRNAGIIDQFNISRITSSQGSVFEIGKDVEQQYKDRYDEITKLINSATDDATKRELTKFRDTLVKDFSKTFADSDFFTELNGFSEYQKSTAIAQIKTGRADSLIKGINEASTYDDLENAANKFTKEFGLTLDEVIKIIAEDLPETAKKLSSLKALEAAGFDATRQEQVKAIFDETGADLAYADLEYMRLTGDYAGEAERAKRKKADVENQNNQDIITKGQSLIGESISKRAEWYLDNQELMARLNVKTIDEFLAMTDEDLKRFFGDVNETLRLDSENAKDIRLQDIADQEAKYQEKLSAYGTFDEEGNFQVGRSLREGEQELVANLVNGYEQLRAAEKDLEKSGLLEHYENLDAELNRVSESYGVDSDEIRKHAQYLANEADVLEEVDDNLQGNYDAAQKIAIAHARLNKGVSELNSNWEENVAILKQTNKASAQYSQTLQKVQKDLANVFNIDQPEVFTEEFIAQHEDAITRISQGDMSAADELSYYVADMLFKMVEATNELSNINSAAISNIILDWDILNDLPVGAELPSQYQGVCDALLAATDETREQIENILSTIGVSYQYEYDKDGNRVGVKLLSGGQRRYAAPSVKPSGGSSKKAKTKYDETNFERYKEITDVIDDNNRAMKEMETIADGLYGASRIDAMQKEVELLKQQAENYHTKRIEAEQYLELDKQRMLAYAEANGIELEVTNNRVTNYRQIMEGLQADIDSHTAKINSFATEEQQSEYIEKYVQPIIDKMEGLQKVIDQFDGTYDIWKDMYEAEREEARKVQEINYNLIQEKYTMKVKLVDNDLKYIETLSKLVSDDIYSAVEKLALVWNPDGSQNQLETMLQNADLLREKANELQAGFAVWQENNLATDGAINRDNFVNGMQEVFNGTSDLIGNLRDLDETLRTISRETLSKVNDEWEYHLKLQERNSKALEYYGKLIPLVYGKNNYEAMKKYYQANLEQSERLYATAATRAERANEHLLRVQQMFNNASVEKQKFLKDALRSAQEEANDAATALEEAHLNALEAKNQEIQNNINAAWQNFEEQLTNGLGFDFLKTSFSNLASIEDLIYTKTEQVYEVNKFLHELSKDMEKTDSAAAKSKIKNFAKETEAMKEQGQLSKFELEVQKAKYNILLAQMALEDAQNAKSIVRLHRDDEGNYGYVYSADPNKLDDAQQKLEDRQHDLYELVKNGTNQFAQALLNEEQTYMQQVQKLQDIYGKDSKEYMEKVAILTEEHHRKMEILEGNYQLAVTELDQAGIEGRKEAYTMYHEEAINQALNWREVDVTTTQIVQENLQELTDYTKDSVITAVGDLGQALEDTSHKAQELSDYMNNELAEALETQVEGIDAIVGAYSTWRGEIQNTIDDLVDLMEVSKKAVEQETGNNKYDAPQEEIAKEKAASGGVSNGAAGGASPGGNGGGFEDPPFSSSSLSSSQVKKYIEDYLEDYSATDRAGIKTYIDFSRKYTSFATLLAAIQQAEKLYFKNKQFNTGRQSIDGPQSVHINAQGGISKFKIAQPYASGGYTGAWGTEGRLAVLHEKELVLNKEDTANMLAAVNIIRKVTSAIDLNTLSNLSSLGNLNTPGYSTTDQTLQQTVTITAEFPNATNHSEIEQAFNNLINRASQFAARR